MPVRIVFFSQDCAFRRRHVAAAQVKPFYLVSLEVVCICGIVCILSRNACFGTEAAVVGRDCSLVSVSPSCIPALSASAWDWSRVCLVHTILSIMVAEGHQQISSQLSDLYVKPDEKWSAQSYAGANTFFMHLDATLYKDDSFEYVGMHLVDIHVLYDKFIASGLSAHEAAAGRSHGCNGGCS